MIIPVLDPREYQKDIYTQLQLEGKHTHILCWHRRLGKTIAILSAVSWLMFKKPNAYLYLYPWLKQAREVIWEGKLEDGRSIIDTIFPKEIVKRKNISTMTIELVNGSTIRLGGADNIDSSMGGQYATIVLDEAAMIERDVYGYLQPIIDSNGGDIIIVSTPRYGSWFNELVISELKEPSEDTSLSIKSAETSGKFTSSELQAIKDRAIKQNRLPQFKTEYLVDLEAEETGSYYGDAINEVGSINLTSKYYAAWDMGQTDETVITVFKATLDKMEVVHTIAGSGKTVDKYLPMIPYDITTHYLPHDAGTTRGYVSSKSASQVLKDNGANVRVLPITKSVMDDINTVRTELESIHFAEGTEQYRMKLKGYVKLPNGKPMHCDYADSFRYAVLGWIHLRKALKPREVSTPIKHNANSWSA